MSLIPTIGPLVGKFRQSAGAEINRRLQAGKEQAQRVQERLTDMWRLVAPKPKPVLAPIPSQEHE